MGQYYTPIIKRSNNNFETYYSHDYNNGLKLMEHSYIGNNFVDTVLKQLYNNPGRLAWVGDYAEKGDYFNGTDLSTFIRESQDEDHELKNRKKPTATNGSFASNKFVINLRTGEYINMAKYIDIAPKDSYGDQIHPVSLLTAVGNGRGGGDYFGDFESMVGDWAGDEIVVRDSEPTSGTDITEDCTFAEEAEY